MHIYAEDRCVYAMKNGKIKITNLDRKDRAITSRGRRTINYNR